MTKLSIPILTLFVFGLNYGQDLIVTKSNDSIQCKITKTKADYVYFIYKKEGKYENTIISKEEVINLNYDFFKGQEIPKDSIPGFEAFSKHRFALTGGYSFDPSGNYGSLPPGFNDHFDELRFGSHFEANYTYYIDKSIGIGITVNYSSSSAYSTGIQATDNFGNIFDTDLSDEMNIFFLGPHFSFRFLNKSQKTAFILRTTLGYLSYENITNLISDVKITGNGLGLASSIGYDIRVVDDLSIGLQVGVISAMFKTYDIQDEFGTNQIKFSRNERPINSARLDFSVGLRYNL